MERICHREIEKHRSSARKINPSIFHGNLVDLTNTRMMEYQSFIFRGFSGRARIDGFPWILLLWNGRNGASPTWEIMACPFRPPPRCADLNPWISIYGRPIMAGKFAQLTARRSSQTSPCTSRSFNSDGIARNGMNVVFGMGLPARWEMSFARMAGFQHQFSAHRPFVYQVCLVIRQ